MASQFPQHGHHITPTKVLGWNLFWLLILMASTVLLARVFHFLPTFPANMAALGIAVTKAYLVINIFMGVKFSTKLTKMYAIGGFVWFMLIFGILVDYATRSWEPVPGWEKTPSSSIPRVPGIKE
ncbi:MAG TPA: cytochrome C oxidase subunit IV family protein [Fimbriimonadaceae bacterium]|nr:cytochrome C oxidase subunit IV family protein [Fimbriimonadaceae bacterium]